VTCTFCIISLLGCGCPSSSLTFQEGADPYTKLYNKLEGGVTRCSETEMEERAALKLV